MTSSGRVLAVDLGASSVRVAAVDLSARIPDLDVMHRWPHGPVNAFDGSLRWDWHRIVSEVVIGLEKGMESGPVDSIGVDGWGVDYGLIDAAGGLVAQPYAYRDGRTAGWRDIAAGIGRERLYELTGIQLMGINTIFQLAVHDRSELGRADRVLLLPDLLVRELVGFESAERSNASTTGLLDARSGDWSDPLIEAIGIERSLFPEVTAAGTRAGTWHDVPLLLVGSHDTASAFLGMPGGDAPGTVFVSTGTWALVGVESNTPRTGPDAYAANVSNEAGALGGFRILENVAGFWLLEQCRAGWGDPPVEELLEEAAYTTAEVPLFDARAERFVAPADMEAEIRDAAGIPAQAARGIVVRSIIESIAAGIAAASDELRHVTGFEPKRVALVGGGTRVPLLQQALERHSGLPVLVGSPEATALGNAVSQGIASGHFVDVARARAWLAAPAASARS